MQAAYGGLTWLIDNREKFVSLFDKLILGVDDLIAGNATGLQTKLLEGLNTTLSTLIDLAARQLGLGDLKTRLSKVTSFIPEQTNKAILAVIDGLAKAVPAALLAGAAAGGTTPPTAPAGLFKGLVGPERRFTYQGKKYILFVTSDSQGKDAKPQIKLALETAQSIKLLKVLESADFVSGSTDEFQALYNAAKGLIDQTAVGSATAVPVRGQSARPTRTTPTADAQKASKLTNASTAFATAIEALKNSIVVDHGCKILLAGCFAAGTKLLTREGWRAVETLREGDEVASRAEHDVYGGVSFKPIEEVFVRTGRVLHLHLSDGQLIRTTPEHPFWVEHEGWTPADMLRAGMRLATLGGEWVSVEEAFDTGEYETVYNCRVAEHHTYFVGDDTHVLAVWAHNTYSKQYYIAQDSTPSFLGKYTLFSKTDGQIVQGTGGVIVRKDTFKLAADFFIHDPNGQAQTQGFPDPKRIHVVQMGPGFDWDGTLDDFNGGMDILNTYRPAPDPITKISSFDMHVLNPTKYATSRKIKSHAHHIVMENGSGPQARADTLAAKAVLRKHHIDPYFSEENLIWAPNFSHTKDYAREVKIRLEDADTLGGKAEVIKELKSIGKDFKEGKWHVI